MSLSPFKRNICVVLLLAALCVATYSNGLRGEFMVDDYGVMLSDPKMHNLKFFNQFFVVEPKSSQKMASQEYFRPFAHLGPMMSYRLFGENVFGHHLFNLVLLYFCAIGFYFLFLLLLRDWRIACLTSAFFCVHPINGVIVNYMTANVYAFMILFMQGSLGSFILAYRLGRKKFYYLGLLGFIFALLCHETTMALPFYAAAILFYFEKPDFKKMWNSIAPYIFVLLCYLWFRLEFASLQNSVLDKIAGFHISFLEYIATLAKLIGWYLGKLLFLKGIVLIWVTDPARYGFVPEGLIFLGLAGCVAIILLKRNKATFALSWFVIGFLPVGFACFRQPDPAIGLTIEPHWLFFSATGFFLLCAIGCVALKKYVRPSIGILFVGALLLAWISSSREYNEIWRTEKKYCFHWVKEAPKLRSIMFFIGSAFQREKDFEKAKYYYWRSAENLTSDWQIYNNIALIECQQGRWDSALDFFKKILVIEPRAATIYNNMGTLYLQKDDPAEAERYFLKAVKQNAYLLEPRLNLAFVYYNQGKAGEAIKLVEENQKVNPRDQNTLNALAQFYLSAGNRQKALDAVKILLAADTQANVLVHLGSLFAQQRDSRTALALYSKAIEKNPRYAEGYLELGKLYGNHEKFNQAIAIWQEGLTMHPQDKRFVELIQMAQGLIEKKQVQKPGAYGVQAPAKMKEKN